MEAVKQWVICIIFCSVAAAVVNILTPDSGVKRAVKTVVSTFLLCAFFSPLLTDEKVNFFSSLPDFSYYESSLSESISEVVLQETEKAVKSKVEELLKSLGVEYYAIEVYLNVNSENEIEVCSISLTIDEKHKHREKQITSNLKSMFSAEAQYIWKKN